MIELLFIGLAPEIKPSPLIQTVIEPQQAIVVPPELTLEEKIKSNYYQCNTDTQYIRADNAECINKPQSPQKPAVRAVNAPQGYYPKGQCTWLVWTKRPVGQWGDASNWLWQAKRDGWATGSKPQAGAIAWRYGHVAYVNSVNGNYMNITEANWDYRGSIRTIDVPITDYTAFIY